MAETPNTSPTCVRLVDRMNDVSSDKPAAASSCLIRMDTTRNHILQLSARVGQLASVVLRDMPLDKDSTSHHQVSLEIRAVLMDLWNDLQATAQSLELDLQVVIVKKMELNRRKYPVELCKGKAGKYTEYSEATGITKDKGQSTLHLKHTTALAPTLQESIPILTRAIREFATERTWSKYHLPRSLVLALLGELGELAELVQWNKDELQEISSATLDKLGQEIADVSIYLIRLSDICGVQFEKEA